MKRKFFVILLLFLLFMISSIYSYAENSDFKYELSENDAIITSYTGSSTKITIPSTIDGHPVKKIAAHAFDAKRTPVGNSLEEVTISEGITTIGDFAFVECTNLKSIKLPESLTSLGDQTFINCSSLISINIPSKITKFGFSGFMFQETGFSEFTIPENVKNIPGSTFRICKNLSKVIVYSDDIKYGDTNVFEYCSKDLVLYGNEGSTTQSYAKENNLKFDLISNLKNTDNVKSVDENDTKSKENEKQSTSMESNAEKKGQTSNPNDNNDLNNRNEKTSKDDTVSKEPLPKAGSKFPIFLLYFSLLSLILFLIYQKHKKQFNI